MLFESPSQTQLFPHVTKVQGRSRVTSPTAQTRCSRSHFKILSLWYHFSKSSFHKPQHGGQATPRWNQVSSQSVYISKSFMKHVVPRFNDKGQVCPTLGGGRITYTCPGNDLTFSSPDLTSSTNTDDGSLSCLVTTCGE